MWGKLPVPKYISHPIFKDNAAATTAFQNGDIDVAQIFITDLQKLWLEQDLPISTYVDEAPYQLCMTMPTLFFNTEVEGCLGVFAWEPQCYGGWEGYHKGMFTDEGRPTSSFNAFKRD